MSESSLRKTLGICRDFSTHHKAVEQCKESKTNANAEVKQLNERILSTERMLRETSEKSANFSAAALFHKASADERLFMKAVEEIAEHCSCLDEAMKRKEQESAKVGTAVATIRSLQKEWEA